MGEETVLALTKYVKWERKLETAWMVSMPW